MKGCKSRGSLRFPYFLACFLMQICYQSFTSPKVYWNIRFSCLVHRAGKVPHGIDGRGEKPTVPLLSDSRHDAGMLTIASGLSTYGCQLPPFPTQSKEEMRKNKSCFISSRRKWEVHPCSTRLEEGYTPAPPQPTVKWMAMKMGKQQNVHALHSSWF